MAEKTFDEQIIHFTELSQVFGKNRRQLQELVDICDMIYDKDLSLLISPEDCKSIMCAKDEQGDICAFLAVEELNDCLELNELFVNYASRKHGVASKLLEAGKEYAKLKGFSKAELVVGINNKVARSLYENKGFIYTKTHQNKVVMISFADEKVNKIAHELFQSSCENGVKNGENVLEEIDANAELDEKQKKLCGEEFKLLQNQGEIIQRLQTAKGL